MIDISTDKPVGVSQSVKPLLDKRADSVQYEKSDSPAVGVVNAADKPQVASASVTQSRVELTGKAPYAGSFKESVLSHIVPFTERSAAHPPSTTLMEDTLVTMEGNVLMGNTLYYDNAPEGAGVVQDSAPTDIVQIKPRGVAYAVSI